MTSTRLLLNSSTMLTLAILASTSMNPVMPPPSNVPEIIPYSQRRTGRNKGEKKRNKAVR